MIWMLFRARDNLDVDVFTVHEPPGPPLDRIEHAASLAFVRDGFSWGAALFSPFWVAVKGQWAALVAYLTVVIAASAVSKVGYQCLRKRASSEAGSTGLGRISSPPGRIMK